MAAPILNKKKFNKGIKKMADITAAMVKELRESTGAGMLDCKKALVEANGNMDVAVDWLRKKGLASAAKKSGRIAAEGLVAIVVKGNKGAAVEVNSETDFVAKNDIFQAYVADAVEAALNCNGDVEALKNTMDATCGKTFGERLTDMVARIGENMNLRRTKVITVDNGLICSYVHNVARDNLGKIGVLVALESAADKAKLADLGKHIAMHIAASAPIAIDIEGVDAAAVEHEKEIFREQAAASGKPANIIEKMVEGRIRKFYDEVVLNEQSYIIDPDKKIKDVVAECAKECGADIKISDYIFFKLGDGLQKRQEDFAAEVNAQLAK